MILMSILLILILMCNEMILMKIFQWVVILQYDNSNILLLWLILMCNVIMIMTILMIVLLMCINM